MNTKLPSLFSSFPFFRHPLALFGSVLLCVAPGLASAQSLTFVGAQTTVSDTSVGLIAVDSSGNVFGLQGNSAVKVPRTATGYGPPIVLPFPSLNQPYVIAVDSGENVYVIDYDTGGNPYVLEALWSGS